MNIQVFWEHSKTAEDLSPQQQHFVEPKIFGGRGNIYIRRAQVEVGLRLERRYSQR
jgi:hypothetical protein